MDIAPDIQSLIDAAHLAMGNAYAPYSNLKVGAAVLAASGRIYSGCNVENASYSLSTCAERTAIFNAVCEGERSIRAVAISNSSNEPAFPCGACRQVIAEFAAPDEDVDIYLVSDRGVEKYTLAELLPHAFKL